MLPTTRFHFLTTSLIVLVGTFLASNAISAAPPGSTTAPSATSPAQPAPPLPNPGATGLNDTSFPQLLGMLGFTKVDTRKNNQNQNYWVITTQKDGWGYVVEIMPTRNQNGQIIGFWFISDLGSPLNNPATVNAPALLKLMEKSHEMAPYFFSFNPVTKHVAMNYEYPGGSIDQAGLQREFNQLFDKIKTTYPLWNTNTLQTGVGGAIGNPAPVVPQPALPQPVVPAPAAGMLDGSSWSGSETLQGFGKLTFQFAAGGKATMIDTAGVTEGTWKQNGNQVTIQFYEGKVTYTGTISGNSMNGSALNNAQNKWTFTLNRQ